MQHVIKNLENIKFNDNGTGFIFYAELDFLFSFLNIKSQ